MNKTNLVRCGKVKMVEKYITTKSLQSQISDWLNFLELCEIAVSIKRKVL